MFIALSLTAIAILAAVAGLAPTERTPDMLTTDTYDDFHVYPTCALYVTNDDTTAAADDWDQLAADIILEEFHLTWNADVAPEYMDELCEVCQDDYSGTRYSFTATRHA